VNPLYTMKMQRIVIDRTRDQLRESALHHEDAADSQF
jgi:hypothetical protein